jgi:DNA polymerase III delta prime subunit
MSKKHVLWVEKYRPTTINDLILTPETRQLLQSYIVGKFIPNVIFQGPPGTGKTSAAIALCKELDYSYVMINGSMYGNIDTLRTDIKDFCQSQSLNGKRKYVILDEADYLNPTSTMPALRNFIEEFSSNAGFIMTLNYPQKIIEPLHSRMAVVNFDFTKEMINEKVKILAQIYNRAKDILKNEKVTFDETLLQQLVATHFKFDVRKLINHLQSHTKNGVLSQEVLFKSSSYYQNLFQLVMQKQYMDCRKWLGSNNIDHEVFTEFNKFIEKMVDSNKLTESQILLIVTIISEHDYRHALVTDKELNISAMLAEVITVLS